jgi:hypothetical protein
MICYLDIAMAYSEFRDIVSLSNFAKRETKVYKRIFQIILITKSLI